MNIKLFIDDGPGSKNMRQSIETYISQMAEETGVKPENIKNVGIASNETYGDAINELLSGERYTNNSEHIGVGKTFSHHKNNNPEHTIVLNLLVFDLILKGAELNNQNKEWPAEVQFGPYMLSHELGHCKFNEMYHKIDPSIEEKYDEPNDIDSLNQHYLKVMIGEVGACFYGVHFSSVELFKYLYKQDHSTFSNLLKELKKAKDSGVIFDVAIIANNITWLYLIQYSKIAIGRFGTLIEKEPILPFGGLQGLAETHIILDQALTEFIESEFIKLEDLKSKLQIARNAIFHELNVALKREGDTWSCYW